MLQEGGIYRLTFNVADRTDQGFGGGTARLVTVDGDVLGTVVLPTPAEGQWASCLADHERRCRYRGRRGTADRDHQ